MRQSERCDTDAHLPDCLVEKFKNYRKLEGDEAMFLSLLQAEERHIARGSELIVQGSLSKYLFVLKQGWAHSYKILGNGERQVLDFLLPGDLLGTRELAFDQALNFVTMTTDGVVCPFPKARLTEMFRQFPNLAATLAQIQTREQAGLVERICNLGCRTAYQRVAHQLLELWVRLRGVGLVTEMSFDFPISQAVLADALGLSTVHVNRTLKKLEQNKLARIANRKAEILDFDRLVETADFEEFYLAKERLSVYLS